MANFSAVGLLGMESDRRTTVQEFQLGLTTVGDDGYDYVYVQANGAIAASQTDIAVDGSFQASDGAGTYVGTTAFADNDYGWVRSATLSHAE